MSTQTTDLAAWLDELDAAHKAATPGGWEAVQYRLFIAPSALPKLTAALRGVLALAEEFDGDGNSRELGDPSDEAWHKAADRIRAVVAAAHTEENS